MIPVGGNPLHILPRLNGSSDLVASRQGGAIPVYGEQISFFAIFNDSPLQPMR
jgi:hypothetical protein